MLRLLPALALLGGLAAPEGTSRTCPACSLQGNCTEITCPSAQDSCLISQTQLENGTLIKNRSCVAPWECRERVYTMTYRPHKRLWVSAGCCESNCSRATQQEAEPEAQSNGVKCHYCPGSTSAPCDSLLVMNCTGKQTVCLTLSGMWRGGPQTTVTHSEAKVTTCFTCSDSHHCDPLPCPADRNSCLQMAGIIALGDKNSFAWRNGSCVASEECKFDNSISSLTYSISFGFWVNTTCCQGNCQEPTPLAALPASRSLRKFLCPTCPGGYPGPCNSTFYMQCPSGETECVRLDLMPEEGGSNVSVRGCGSRDLCRAPAGTWRLQGLPGYRPAHRPDCSSSSRAILDSECHSGAAPGLRLALPALAVALGTAALP